jgi:hypothetical protein
MIAVDAVRYSRALRRPLRECRARPEVAAVDAPRDVAMTMDPRSAIRPQSYARGGASKPKKRALGESLFMDECWLCAARMAAQTAGQRHHHSGVQMRAVRERRSAALAAGEGAGPISRREGVGSRIVRQHAGPQSSRCLAANERRGPFSVEAAAANAWTAYRLQSRVAPLRNAGKRDASRPEHPSEQIV